MSNAEAAVLVGAAPLAITDEIYLVKFDPDGQMHQTTETEQFADALADTVYQSGVTLKEAVAALSRLLREEFDWMRDVMEDIVIYANGVCFCSVCAPAAMLIDEVTRLVNEKAPTGLDHGWELDDVGEFADGTPMPTECPQDDERLHYLFSC